jgi:hypothetical protein
MDWRIYYHDGSTFSDDDGPAQDAPGLGVLLIVQWDGDLKRTEILHGDGPRVVDWYWWEDDVWLCGDFSGMVQHIAESGWKKVLSGRNVRNETFRTAMKRASRDTLGR